jgi:hypothetical protein
MSNQFDKLLQATQRTDLKPISRAQLPLLLAKVDGVRFAGLLFEWFGFVLDDEHKQWFSLDGKELRGSLQPGDTRGEVIVSAVSHQNGQVLAQAYYCGAKESERPTVAELIEKHKLASQKLSLDALHMIPSTLRQIGKAGGQYVVGLKANQPHLYQLCTVTDLFKIADYERIDAKVTCHGRVEQRTYRCFTLPHSALHQRWQPTGLCTLICVLRQREISGNLGEEVSYYVSNQQPTDQSEADELFNAVRGHWVVEVMHHKRDVTLSEDDLRTKKVGVNRLVGSLRTLVINLLEGMNSKNMTAQMDTFADKFSVLIQFLTQQMVL